MKDTITVSMDHYQKLLDIPYGIHSVIDDTDYQADRIDEHFDRFTIGSELIFEMKTNIVNRITDGK